MRVLFLDDDEDLREAMRELLGLLGHDVLAAGSVDELADLGAGVFTCALAILDLNLGSGRPTGVDARRWLCSRGFTGGIVFLTGHGRSYAVMTDPLCAGGAPRVFEKPMSVGRLQALLAEADGRWSEHP